MSTAAVWAYSGVAVLFVAAVIFVVSAVRSTYRRSRALAAELQDLAADADEVMRPGKGGRHAGKSA
ncbi:MAG: hypothetical protein ACOCUN_02175 [Jiangellaceae bacterium]